MEPTTDQQSGPDAPDIQMPAAPAEPQDSPDDAPRRIEFLPLSKLEGAETNPRIHHEVIGTSIARFGFADAPILDERTGCLVAGHGRRDDLLAKKAAGEVPPDGILLRDDGEWLVPVQRGWASRSDAEAASFLVTHNRSSDLGSWEDDGLGVMLANLLEEGEPLPDLGWPGDELRALLADDQPPGEDPGPSEPPADPVSKRGEVYELGPHRLMCGDSTSEDDVAHLLDGATPRLMVTDPPYGVDYDPAWRQRAAEEGHLAYAARRVGEVANDDSCDWEPAWLLSPSIVAYCWAPPGAQQFEHQSALERAGFQARVQIIWAKRHFPISRGHYHWRHEPCWYAVRKGETAAWIGGRDQTTIWDDITLDANVDGGHSTQKPLECMERPIRNHEGDVYDPFLGSGTTLIASARQGRRCYGMEISPAYCDVIRRRWGDYARSCGIDPGPGAL